MARGRIEAGRIYHPIQRLNAFAGNRAWLRAIFPIRACEGTSLLISGVRDIGPSYARTLREWRTRFMGSLPDVRALGFDERFIRMWEFYLAQSEAGFSTGAFQDLQITFTKRRGTVASWSGEA